MATNYSPDYSSTPAATKWTLAQKLAFRFFFIYLVLKMANWWHFFFPYVGYITQYLYQLLDWATHFANDHFFHIRKELGDSTGSDNSYGWVQQWLYICFALIGCVIWSLTD